MTDTPPPVAPKAPSDMVRRLQIGIGGVIAVLLLVGLAQIVGERSVDDASTDPATAAANAAAANNVAKAEQPLVDLGVQPNTDAPETPEAALPPPAGTSVPDLAPDPALDPARAPAR